MDKHDVEDEMVNRFGEEWRDCYSYTRREVWELVREILEMQESDND